MPTAELIIACLEAQPIRLRELKKQLQQCTANDLSQICRTHPSLVQKLVRKDLEPFWHQFREKFTPRAKVPKFRYTSQSYVHDADLILGLIFYYLGTKEETYWGHALSHDSFNVAYILLNKAATELQNSQLDKEQFLKGNQNLQLFINEIMPSITRHESAGFLLLANIYFSLSNAASKQGEPAMAETTMFFALKYAYCAQILDEGSENCYHNAYFGESLKHSNAFGFDSVDKMIEGLQKKAEPLIDLTKRTTVISEARVYCKTLALKKRIVRHTTLLDTDLSINQVSSAEKRQETSQQPEGKGAMPTKR